MPRTTKPAEERKGEILDVAQRLFMTKGFQATTMEEILAEVGIAKGTLYHHFPGKEQILEGLVLRTVAQIGDRARAVAQSDAPALEKFVGVLAASRVEGSSDDLTEEFHSPGNAEFHVLSIVETVRCLTPILVDVVRQGVEEGTFATDQPREVVEILLVAGGMLLDRGIFPGEEAQMPRRAIGVIRAAETLLGCPEGTLTSILGRLS